VRIAGRDVSSVTIGQALRWALLGQVALAVMLLISDGLGGWRPGSAPGEALPSGPVAPGDQRRRFDPGETRPDFAPGPLRPEFPATEAMPDRLTFLSIETEAHGPALLLRGPITEGDADRLEAHLAAAEAAPEIVALDSPGGLVREALRIGRTLRGEALDTLVADGMICVSSCPYVLAGGVARIVGPDAAVGLHQHYYDTPGYMPVFFAVQDIQSGQAETMRHLIDMGVDPGVMVHALATPPEQIYVLVAQELLDTQLATEIR
jgi:hypothetical protein